MNYRHLRHNLRRSLFLFAAGVIAGGGGGSSGSIDSASLGRDNDDFDTYSTGSGLMDGWTESGTITNISYEIVTDGTSPGGQAFEIVKSPSDTSRVIITKDSTSGDDLSALLHFEATANAAVGLVINWNVGSQNGYFLGVDVAGGTLALYSCTAGSYTLLDSTAFTFTATTEYYLRFSRRPNGELAGRIWTVGSVEPSTWMVSNGTGTTYTSGVAGIDIFSSNTYTATIHKFSVGQDGQQGCEINDADFPLEGVYYTDSSDETLRIMEEDGSNQTVLFVYDDAQNIDGVAVRQAYGQVFFAGNVDGSLNRTDRFGTRYSKLQTGLNINTLTYNNDDDVLYYNRRIATNGEVHVINPDGTGDTILNSSINWASQIYYENGEIYISSLNTAYALDKTGTIVHIFPNDTNQIAIAADASKIYTGSFSGGILSSTDIRGTGYTNDDATAPNLWQLAVDRDKTQIFGASLTTNILYRWTALPPTSGNRTSIVTQGVPIGIAPFKFIAP